MASLIHDWDQRPLLSSLGDSQASLWPAAAKGGLSRLCCQRLEGTHFSKILLKKYSWTLCSWNHSEELHRETWLETSPPWFASISSGLSPFPQCSVAAFSCGLYQLVICYGLWVSSSENRWFRLHPGAASSWLKSPCLVHGNCLWTASWTSADAHSTAENTFAALAWRTS